MKAVYSILLSILLSLITCTAHAAAFTITPILLTLTNEAPITSITFTNVSDKHVIVQADIIKWTKSQVMTHGAQSDDLAISPPFFSLSPNQSQLVRIAWLKQHMIDKQLTYRVIAREVLPSHSLHALNKASALNVSLAFSIPLFIQPTTPRMLFSFVSTKLNANTLSITLKNRGNITLFINQIELFDHKQKVLSKPTFAYILPSQENVWTFKTNEKNVTNIRAMINGEWKQYSARKE